MNYIVNVVHSPLILPYNIAWSYIPNELYSECSTFLLAWSYIPNELHSECSTFSFDPPTQYSLELYPQ